MPIVDHPFDFEAIAAANAIAHVYAMGGTPLFALASVGRRGPRDAIVQLRRAGGSGTSRRTEWALLTDPLTSDGLLVACVPEAVEQVLAAFGADGFEGAAVIGEVSAGVPGVNVAQSAEAT